MSRSMAAQQPWPWPRPETMDAQLAAPASHRVRVRRMEPEVPHSAWNLDVHRYHAMRVELR